mmetsp:Transcript_49849/g.57542  ORF Transcript_49849/g.57542 Transcript_49849/m.57542 type:complete len:84 (-) Transcript_49849:1783-2034(-)
MIVVLILNFALQIHVQVSLLQTDEASNTIEISRTDPNTLLSNWIHIKENRFLDYQVAQGILKAGLHAALMSQESAEAYPLKIA